MQKLNNEFTITNAKRNNYFRGVASGGEGGGAGGHGPLTSISKPNKVQQVQFQTSGILFFTSVQKLYGPKIFTVYATIFGQFMAAFHFF